MSGAREGTLSGVDTDVLGELDVRPDPNGVRSARAFCTATLTTALAGTGIEPDDLDDLVADAEMVTSELVSNAVRAEASRVVLEISRLAGRLRIAVLDDAHGEVHTVHHTPLGLNGRGLRIVDTLAEQWGVQPWPAAKTVWADLTLALPVESPPPPDPTPGQKDDPTCPPPTVLNRF